MESILNRINDTIEQHSLLSPGQHVLVAVSGGPDSIFLAWALHTIGFPISLAHVNYKLRGADSESEEALVSRYAADWKVPLFVHKLDTLQQVAQSPLSLQMLAREARYQFFEEVMASEGIESCATGHHLGDQAETILLSLTKDKDFDIFHSIPYRRGPYIRPLLDLSKEEILQTLTEQGLAFGQDVSNFESSYSRNRIRNGVLPQLAKINPSIESQLIERAGWYERQMAFISYHFDHWYQLCVTYDPNTEEHQLNWDLFVREYGRDFLDLLLVFVLRRWGLHGQALWEATRLVESQPGREVLLQEKRIARIRDGLCCQPLARLTVKSSEEIRIEREDVNQEKGQCEVQISGRKVKITLPWRAPVRLGLSDDFYCDSSKVVFPIKIRPWREGDRMMPFGMRQSKKLSDIFVDEKYSAEEKNRSLVIEDAEKIIALSGFRVSDAVKLDNKTREVMRIVIHD